MDEHPAAPVGRIRQNAGGQLQHVDNHLDQRFEGEKHAVIGRDVFRKLVQEVFVDAADHIAAHIIQRIIVEDAQQLRQQLVREKMV